jgi:deoxyribodipyrimidine photo-lyase
MGITLFWFRRDLRLFDNHALYRSLQKGNVLPIFIFDKNIIDKIDNKKDPRVNFIFNELKNIKSELEAIGSSIHIMYDKPLNAFHKITKEYKIDALFFNHDYEPYAIERDREITHHCATLNIPVYTFKDQVIFEKNEILKSDEKPYTIFTPYMRKWKEKLKTNPIQEYPSEKLIQRFVKTKPIIIPDIEEIVFTRAELAFPTRSINTEIISNYNHTRDFPAINGTSKLSIHLRFGTISIRQLVKKSFELSETYVNELIWREFYMMILYNFPHVADHSFKSAYDRIEWTNNEKHFEAWCNGTTGYPIVDAGMRELNKTGFMHNRVRMITASFLTKHLLIDWRWGEAYFAQKLMDYELSSNNGGWQWAASTGCDAVPYFRIFNPELQTKRFDPDYEYICKWVPEYDTKQYPKPIINHTIARERAIKTFKKVLQ